MQGDISPSALMERIEAEEQVTVLDVRNTQRFEQWHIDGPSVDAVNVPVNTLRTTDPEAALADVPTENVVAVCNSGNSSRTAVRALDRAGIDAANLEGGMNGWADLYTHEEIDVDTGATVVQFRRPSSGCLAYMVVDGDEAAVVDPLLAFSGDYAAVAESYGADLTYAVDTHVHADHISGVRDLARRTAATAVLPAPAEARGVDYDVSYETVADGDELTVGDATIEVLHTPGHTSGMTAFHVDGVLLTGDGLFTDSVARPDLEADADGAPDAAAQLHESLTDRVLAFPDDTVVAPAHHGGGAETAADGTVTATLGEVAAEVDALGLPVEPFVEQVLADMPPRPANYEQIIETNLGVRETPAHRALQLELGPNNCSAGAAGD